MSHHTDWATLWWTFSWQALRQHPWRHGVAVLAVMLGVALALAVQLINASALSEFAYAVQQANGEPDAQLRSASQRLDDRWLDLARAHPAVKVASPVLEVQTALRLSRAAPEATSPSGPERHTVRLWGVDGLSLPALQPGLGLVPHAGVDRLAMLGAGGVFANPAAQALLDHGGGGRVAQFQTGTHIQRLPVLGHVAVPGGPLLALDVAALQDLMALPGVLTRIDLRLAPGTDLAQLLADLRAQAQPWAAELQAPALMLMRPSDSGERLSQLSRAYRVNLTVLALVALFTGAFLVFSVLSLSITQRLPALALLGVLGLSAAQRQRLVWLESVMLGVAGSVAGVALGTALAWAALQWLGGDLGGGYFDGVAPRLQWQGGVALAYGLLGVVAAWLGGWWPALTARHLAPAQALKGVPMQDGAGQRRWWGPAALLAAVGLSLLPPVAGVPLAAYLAVALGLLGGILTLPALVHAGLGVLAPRVQTQALLLLALERARRFPHSTAVATSGVVASLALSVALTVMVSSFRLSVSDWLDQVLPADLYVRAAAGAGGAETVPLPPAWVAQVAALPGVLRVDGQRHRSLWLAPDRPPVTLIGRPLATAPGQPLPLPLVGPALPPPSPPAVAVYVSEALAALYAVQPGQALDLPGVGPAGTQFVVSGVWRDYARQHGAVVVDRATLAQLTGDDAVNDLAVVLAPGADPGGVTAALQTLGDGALEWQSSRKLREISLKIFDRSFAVTTWLQAVAIAMGLMGVSASYSAQVLVRRREFGLLAHLGLSRRQILALVTGEGALWSLLGTWAGLALGLAVSAVLVFVVNPQSFHWTMQWHLPWPRLLALCAAVWVAGTLTAWLSGRLAASAQAVQAVKQDH